SVEGRGAGGRRLSTPAPGKVPPRFPPPPPPPLPCPPFPETPRMIRRRTFALLAVAALAAPSPVHAQSKLTVAVGGRGIGESCLTEIGKNAGMFARHGLDLDLVYTDGGGETQQAVVSNSAQIGVTSGMLGAMSLFAKGAPVRVIGSSYSGGSQSYWYVPAGSAVKTPQDLDGRSVSYSNFSSASHVGLLAPAEILQAQFQADTDRQRGGDADRDHERADRCRLGRRAVRHQ